MGMETGTAIVGDNVEVPEKPRVAMRSRNPTPGHINRETLIGKNTCILMSTNVHSSTSHNSQDMEAN